MTKEECLIPVSFLCRSVSFCVVPMSLQFFICQPSDRSKGCSRKIKYLCPEQETIIKVSTWQTLHFLWSLGIESKTAWVVHLINCTFISYRVLGNSECVLKEEEEGSSCTSRWVLWMSFVETESWSASLRRKSFCWEKEAGLWLVMSFCCLEGQWTRRDRITAYHEQRQWSRNEVRKVDTD